MLRLTVYLLICVTAFSFLTSFGHPFFNYLHDVHSTTQIDQRQAQMVKIDARVALLRGRITALLQQNPSLARVRVAIIHDGISGNGISEIQFDIIAGVAAPQHLLGEFVSNQSLTQWSDYLTFLIAEKCTFQTAPQIKNSSAHSRINELNIKAFLVCPVVNGKHQLIGGIFASWDTGDNLPTDMGELTNSLTAAADAISRNLHVQP